MTTLRSSKFRAILEPVPHGGCYVVVPPKVADAAGLTYKARVRGTVNGKPYRSSLMKYSGVFHVGVHKATLEAAGVDKGDRVDLTIELDPDPLPADAMPEDLGKALDATPGARAAFDKLSPSHRREHVNHVMEAKQAATRTRRIEKTVAALAPKKK